MAFMTHVHAQYDSSTEEISNEQSESEVVSAGDDTGTYDDSFENDTGPSYLKGASEDQGQAPKNAKSQEMNELTSSMDLVRFNYLNQRGLQFRDYLRNSSIQDGRKLILSPLKGSKVATFLSEHPKILDLYIYFLRDERTFDSLTQIIKDRDRLKTYGYVTVCFILGLFISSFIFFPSKTLWDRIKSKVIQLFILSVGNLIIVYVYFSIEIKVFYDVFKKVFKSLDLF